jgi:hypothetical protein
LKCTGALIDDNSVLAEFVQPSTLILQFICMNNIVDITLIQPVLLLCHYCLRLGQTSAAQFIASSIALTLVCIGASA